MILYQFTEHMAQRDVTFLDPRCQGGRHDKRVVNQSGERASRSAGPGHGDEPAFTRRRDAFQDIGGVPARTDADGDIALAAMSSNLAGEELFIPIVIGDARNRGDVRCQGDRGEGHAVASIAPDEFSRDVRRIGGAASITEEKNLIAAVEGLGDECGELYDAIGMLARELLLDLSAFGKCA